MKYPVYSSAYHNIPIFNRMLKQQKYFVSNRYRFRIEFDFVWRAESNMVM